MSWPDRRLLDLFGIEVPIVQAPMANACGVDMAVAVADAGGLGSLPCAGLTDDKIRKSLADISARSDRPINLNFFCHEAPASEPQREQEWLDRLKPYYLQLGVEPPSLPLRPTIYNFTEATCALVEELRPAVVSFHFGLPAPLLFDRVKAAGCKTMSTATSVREARFLAECGVDAIIAQGAEAGGHRGMFLETDIAAQVGTFALLPQVAQAVSVPVVAAGGIGDARGMLAAFTLGASGVQLGTAYLRCPEATISSMHKDALGPDRETVITNVLSGRPARGVFTRLLREQGPLAAELPAYPLPTPGIAPLRKAAEAKGSTDFSPLWSGQGPPPRSGLNAGELTRRLAQEALERLSPR